MPNVTRFWKGRAVWQGELFLPPESAGKLVRGLQQGGNVGAALSSPLLSPRQLDVLSLAAGGLSDAQIAGRLILSESTVRVHFHHIIEKLGVTDRAVAITWYEQSRSGTP